MQLKWLTKYSSMIQLLLILQDSLWCLRYRSVFNDFFHIDRIKNLIKYKTCLSEDFA